LRPNFKSMKHIYALAFVLFSIAAGAQTNPTVQTIPYTQDFSGLAHTSTTYPAGWQGWTISTAPAATFNTAAPTADRILTASGTAGINSGNIYNYDGKIGFLNTGSLDLSLVLAVNTTGATNVPVSYDIMTLRNPHDGASNTRINEVTLQYRVGTTGNFTDLTGVLYQNNTTTQTGTVTTPQNISAKTLILPAACNNQPIVQLRWVSRQVSGGGARPSFAVDNVAVGTTIADIIPPVVNSTTPANNATNVLVNTGLQIVFSETIVKGTGNITVRNATTNSIVQIIDVTTAAVTVAGSNASITVNTLAPSTNYAIQIDNTAFKDLANNNYAGIANNTTWNFTTANTSLALVNTDFATCTTTLTDGFTNFSVTGAQVWACTSFGRGATPTTNAPNGVQINGFASGSNVQNEDWLISPVQNLTSTAFPLLSFWSRTAFNGAALKLKVSTNYTGTGNPNAATWVDLNGGFPAQASDIWTESKNINLSAYKTATTYFAFVYNSTNDDGARWTLDDIKIENSATPPPTSITSSTQEVNFNFVAANTSAVKTFVLNANDIVAGVTLTTSSPNFAISKTNSNFTSSISYTQSEANNLPQTIYVRFTPTVATTFYNDTVRVNTTGVAEYKVSLKGNSVDAASTLEVVNWNIEWFGSPSLGPSNDALQETNVRTILQSLNADIYAVQEVVSEARLASVVAQMPGYTYVISNFGSNANPFQSSPSPIADAQKLAYIYKSNLFTGPVTTQALLSAGVNTAADLSNPAYNWFSSGRYPYMLTGTTTLNGITKIIRFINVHAKANTSPTATSYARRKAGNDSLRIFLNANYPNDNIMFLGDFNDDLDSTITAGINPKLSSYQQFIDDNTNFTKITRPLSLAGKRSTVSFPDVIDHVIISNDLACSYLDNSAAILTDVASLVANYGNTTTDHYPVLTRYLFQPQNNATISYVGNPYCSATTTPTATPTINGTTGGSFSSTTGLVINSTTGVIDVATSTAGVYTVTYAIAANGVCNPAINTTATVSIKQQNVEPTSIVASNNPICNILGGTTNLTVNGGNLGAGATWRWYTGSCGGTLIGTGAQLTNVPVTNTTAFFVRAEGGCNTSNCATVNVVVAPAVAATINVNPTTGIKPGSPATLIATVSPADNYTYTWVKDNTQTLANNTGSSILVYASQTGNYKVTAKAANGCTSTTPNLFVQATTSKDLHVSPNPNKGVFNVSYYNGGPITTKPRTVNVYGSNGQRIYSNSFVTTIPFGNIVINLGNVASGIYSIELIDNSGIQLATTTVRVL
jgi:hypothetical protein